MPWPERIETARLILRAPIDTDAAAIFRPYTQDTDVTRYLMWRPHEVLADAHEYIARCQSRWRSSAEFTWMLTGRVDGEVLGAIALRPDGHKAAIGYVLTRAYWGQALMPEAARALLDHARGIAELHRVWAVCDVDNLGSARVMEKIGMAREGLLRRWVVHPNIGTTLRDALCYSWIRPSP